MKLIHISDLHFGAHSEQLVNAFLADLQEIKPEIIIISGDLTQRAKQWQYHLLNDFLNKLPGKYLVVPGNHDIPLYNPFLRVFQPFNRYKKYVSPSLTSTFENEDVRILGVSSVNPSKVKSGIISENLMDEIFNHFSEDTPQLNILFFHHNFNYFSGLHNPLHNSKLFIERLKNSHIHLVCTGHLHYANLMMINKKNQRACSVLHAGSLSCLRTKDGKNSYYAIELEGLKCTIDWRIFSDLSFKSNDIFSVDFSKIMEKN